VSGRAGRSGDLHGEVIIQTSRPESTAIRCAISGDYESFYHAELENRRKALYPPFSRFIVIEFSGKDDDKVHTQCAKMIALFPKDEPAFRFYGPVQPSIVRLKEYYRRLIVIKNDKSLDKSGRILRHYLKYAVDTYNEKYSTSTENYFIDTDSFSGSF
jgi:primosomal protein N' (replication factor Y)